MAIDTLISTAIGEFPFQKPAPYFAEEKKGWTGYIEWERYPEKKAEGAKVLAQYNFPHPPEFQLVPPPASNPLLEGVRWK